MFLSESWHEPDVKRKLRASFKKKKKLKISHGCSNTKVGKLTLHLKLASVEPHKQLIASKGSYLCQTFPQTPPPQPSPCGIAVVQQSCAQRNRKPSGQQFTGRWEALRCTAAAALPGANLQGLGTLEVVVAVGVACSCCSWAAKVPYLQFNRLLSKYTDKNLQS